VAQLKRINNLFFGTNYVDMGPLESVFGQLDFKPMVFGTLKEMSSNVKDYIDLTEDDGAEQRGEIVKNLHYGCGTLGTRAKVQGATIYIWRHGGDTRACYYTLSSTLGIYMIEGLNKDQIKLDIIIVYMYKMDTTPVTEELWNTLRAVL